MTKTAEHKTPDPIMITWEQFQYVFYVMVSKNTTTNNNNNKVEI